MSNPHDTAPDDYLVATDLRATCPCCDSKDWYVEGYRNHVMDYKDPLFGKPSDIVAVGPMFYTAQCRACGAVGKGTEPREARDSMNRNNDSFALNEEAAEKFNAKVATPQHLDKPHHLVADGSDGLTVEGHLITDLSSTLVFHDQDGTEAVVINIAAGTVELKNHYQDKLDDAAKLFWECVQKFAATCK